MPAKKVMEPDQAERYKRWQDYRITQLFFSINLFLGFAVASAAYAVNLILQGDVPAGIPLKSIVICWSVSATFGCLATISRLLDFRYTARKIKNGGGINAFMSKWNGRVTWGCFWVQLACYGIGAAIFIAGIVNA